MPEILSNAPAAETDGLALEFRGYHTEFCDIRPCSTHLLLHLDVEVHVVRAELRDVHGLGVVGPELIGEAGRQLHAGHLPWAQKQGLG